ncbi:MAG: DUF423 domain-containing protein [Ignavibacteriaceae bacterium]
MIIAGVAGFTGVAIGAFGAHGLRNILSPESVEIYKTGVMYHLIHSVAILAIAVSGSLKFFKSALFFLIGIILFSFSLYLYAVTNITAFAIITPLGGISFLTGWILIIVEGLKN